MAVLDLQFASDLHLERNSLHWSKMIIPAAKYLILAGDIAPWNHHKLSLFYDWCRQNFLLTIHVAGNHEYRNGEISTVDNYLYELASKYNIIYAQNLTIELEKVKLACCTLWSDTPDNIPSNDFKFIEGFNHQYKRELFYRDCSFIATSQADVVITHHAPLLKDTLRSEHLNDRLRFSYASNLPNLVDNKIAWIFGHTHHVCDIIRPSGTLVTSNPIGYPYEHLDYSASAVCHIKLRE